MKTPDEIKKGLGKCSTSTGVCDECAFSNGNAGKWKDLMGYALVYIQQLERERDALLEDLKLVDRFDCVCCVHAANGLPVCDMQCDACKNECMCNKCTNNDRWEWRGMKEDDK